MSFLKLFTTPNPLSEEFKNLAIHLKEIYHFLPKGEIDAYCNGLSLEDKKKFITSIAEKRQTPLHFLCQADDFMSKRVLRNLIESLKEKIDSYNEEVAGKVLEFLNKTDIDGRTALHIVADDGSGLLYRFMVENGFATNIPDKVGETPSIIMAKFREESLGGCTIRLILDSEVEIGEFCDIGEAVLDSEVEIDEFYDIGEVLNSEVETGELYGLEAVLDSEVEIDNSVVSQPKRVRTTAYRGDEEFVEEKGMAPIVGDSAWSLLSPGVKKWADRIAGERAGSPQTDGSAKKEGGQVPF